MLHTCVSLIHGPVTGDPCVTLDELGYYLNFFKKSAGAFNHLILCHTLDGDQGNTMPEQKFLGTEIGEEIEGKNPLGHQPCLRMGI